MKLLFSALIKFLMGILLVGLLLFLPAGGFSYMNGWLFLGLLFLPMLIFGVVLFIKSPSLLEKRLDAKESDRAQRGVVAASGLLFVLGSIVAGLDYRTAGRACRRGELLSRRSYCSWLTRFMPRLCERTLIFQEPSRSRTGRVWLTRGFTA